MQWCMRPRRARASRQCCAWWRWKARVVAVLALCTRAQTLCTTLLRDQLGFRVNSMILDKALTLDLEHFEDSEFYDRLTRARREASQRPLSLVLRSFALAQNLVSLASFAALLIGFSPWAVVLLVLAGLAGIHRRSEVLQRRVPAVSLALVRAAHAGLPRDGAGARGSRQGSETVRAGQAAAGPVQVHPSRPAHAGAAAGHPARLVGLCTGIAGNAGTVFRLCMGRSQRSARPYHRRPDDHVPAVVPAGAGRGERGARGGQRVVRRQSLPLDPLRIPRYAGAAQVRHGNQWPGPNRRAAPRACELHVSGRGEAGACGHIPAPAARPQPGAGGRQWLGQDHADQADHAPVRADAGADPARWPRPCRVGRIRAAAKVWRDLPGFRPLSTAGGRKHRRRRRALFRGRGTLARGGAAGQGG